MEKIQVVEMAYFRYSSETGIEGEPNAISKRPWFQSWRKDAHRSPAHQP